MNDTEQLDEAPAAEEPADQSLAQRTLTLVQAAEEALATLLAGSSDPGELIHDYRVSLRRLRSVLRILGPAYGKKRMERHVDVIRNAGGLTGDLRDEEVLRESLTELRVNDAQRVPLSAWMSGRQRRERGQRTRIVRVIKESKEGNTAHEEAAELLATLKDLHQRLDAKPKKTVPDGQLASKGLRKAYDKVMGRSEGDLKALMQNKEAFHSLRIAAKQLRYTTEFTAGILKPGGWEEATEAIATKLQKHLGKLHDLDEATLRMGRARGLDLEARTAVLEAIAKQRIKVAGRCVSEVIEARKQLPLLLKEVLETA